MWKNDKTKCLRCGACVGVCPKSSLDLQESGLVNDHKTCILCGICEKTCPAGAIKVTK